MSEVKDPKIKLFGKTIELPDNLAAAAADEGGERVSAQSREADGGDSSNQDPPCSSDCMVEDSNLSGDAGEQEPVEDSNAPSADSNSGSMKMSKTEEDQTETSNSQDKTLKKPDKILPCPRCNSMDTKFCYFNNYNVNQPRHFCKNCQRYWTAGGTMRNVPVGAGRRKNKNSISQFRHLTVPESLQTACVDLPNGIQSIHPNGTVLTFGSDSPLCESIASVLNIVDKNVRNASRNGSRKPEEELGIPVPTENKENGDKTRLSEPMPNSHPFPPQVPCYPGGPWPYPWNNPVQWGPPNFSPASFPVPFYPTAPPYWGWNVPWVIQPTPAPTSGPSSPTLGKHLRDDSVANAKETVKESNSEKCLWVPKTLRIDDPGEAAKSSIWATLGIKNERADSVGGGRGLFKAFRNESKGGEKSHVLETSTVLQANPAALSRKKVSIYLFKFQSLFYQYISKKNKDSQSPTKKVLEEQSVCRGDVEMVFRSLGILGNGDHQDEKFQERLGVSDIFNIFEDQNPNLDEVKEAFEVFDENRDGFFDAGDLQRVLCGLGLKEGLEMENCRKMICVFDENGDGRMDFDERV
ncbi:hypothetical protein DH2020_036968 [Rehmannia glutinosa]|uniref:Dof-type domain-containing protein n=1 Tax=Rehmannia glutinosa TaxID=99300 RepID=A0ABR0V481_REHGL